MVCLCFCFMHHILLTHTERLPQSPTPVCFYQVEEDRYKEMLNRSDSENIASSYFKSKRASQLLGREATKTHSKIKMYTYIYTVKFTPIHSC